MATTQGPKQTAIAIAPEISALVIVDMQNFFLSPEFRHHPLGLAAVAPTIKVIEKCRAAGIQVGQCLMINSRHDIRVLHS
jgi:isochorismate hydrolase